MTTARPRTDDPFGHLAYSRRRLEANEDGYDEATLASLLEYQTELEERAVQDVAGRDLRAAVYGTDPERHPENSDLWRRWSPSDLVAENTSLEWLIRGFVVQPTYGQVAGEEKTLKTYIGLFIDLAVATGTPLFGRLQVGEARPVVSYVGEGGRLPYTRRLLRVARAMGVRPADADLRVVFDVAAIDTQTFQRNLMRDLADRPGLLHIDPLYAYHGAGTDSRNLHQEGSLLSSLSAPCMEAGTSLLVTNHFNQTGSGRGLKRITQAGSAEWSDSWVLVSHRSDPDVAAGRFRLLLEVGSRQWGGTPWELDLNIGTFDPDTGTHDGDITFDLRRAEFTVNSGGGAGAAGREQQVIDRLTDEPWKHTRSQLLDELGGKKDAAVAAVRRLEDNGRIRTIPLLRQEGSRQVTRHLFGLSDQPNPEGYDDEPVPLRGPGWDGLDR